MASTSNITLLPRVPALSWDDCRLLVESVVDYAIFMLDVDGRVATWNIGAEKIKGYRADEIIGQHFSKFFTTEDVTAGKPQRELAIAAELGRFEDESFRVRQDGSRFWANVIITALRDETGKLRGFGKVTRDLSTRRATEERLRQAEERFHKLVDGITDYAIYLLDETGHVASWNVGAQKTKGYTADEIIGQHFSVFYPDAERAAHRPEHILERVRQEGRFEEENWRVRKDGTRFWASVVITALRDDQGQLTGFAKITRDLTERRRASEQLRRSEDKFRLLVQHVTDYAIYMLDPEGRVTTWNLGAKRMKGYEDDDIIGQSFERFFLPEEVAAGRPAHELERAREDGRYEDDGWRVRKDGSRFWANAVLTALHDQRGKLVGFAKVTRDLTEQRAAEEQDRQQVREQTARDVAERGNQKLQASQERYRELSQRLEAVLEGVADGITAQDQEGRVLFANAAAAELTGFASSAELMALPFADIMSRFELSDPGGRLLQVSDLPAARVLAGADSASQIIHVHERASKRRWWAQVRARAVQGGSDERRLAINIWHDVTFERLRDIQARYVADATNALAASTSPDTMLAKLASLLVPGLADRCSAYLREGDALRDVGLAQGSPAQLSPEQQRAGAVWKVINSGNTQIFDDSDEPGIGAALIAPIRVRDRVLGALALIRTKAGPGYDAGDAVLAQELGRRAGVAVENAQLLHDARGSAKAAEEAARQAAEAAETAAQASRAKDEFLAVVSHELRTPLNAILGWATLLKERETDSRLAKPIAIIHRNALAQVRIIEDILDVARVISGKLHLDPRPADAASITRDALEVVRPSAEAKRITLDLELPAEPCLLVADPERLQQVIWNLLSNAVKFTEPGGTVHLSVAKPHSRVLLTVSDTGQGIDPAFLPFVFDRFKQADASTTRRVGGLGLGLALVRHIVELHGGTVAASSAGLGHGSVFHVTLPIRAVAPSQVPTATAFKPRITPVTTVAKLDGVRVLVVDDEPDARDLVATVLLQAGAEVATAGSAAEGFDSFREFQPDVLVSDIGMPDEDGYSFIARIRQLACARGSLPALALTAFARKEDQEKAVQAGFTAHLSKPVDPGVLATSVAHLAALGR